MLIVDASVVARFLLVEDLSDKAKAVLEDCFEGKLSLEAPRLLAYEIGNVLWKAARQGYVNPEDALKKFRHLLKTKIHSIELGEREYLEALQWSIETNTTYYDSAYVEAAKKIKAPLLTADDALYEKASKEIPTIHLKNYEKLA